MERPVPVDGCFAGRRSGDGSGTTGATMRAMTRRILLVLTAAGGLTLALATPAGAVTIFRPPIKGAVPGLTG